MTTPVKSIKPGDFGIVKYFESAQPEFKKYGFELVATFTEFKVCEEKSGSAIFMCSTITGVDGFLRGITYAYSKKNNI